MDGGITLSIMLLPGKHTKITSNIYADLTDSERTEFEKAVNDFKSRLDKIQNISDPRCRNCKHWGRGKATINAYHLSFVCFKMRKEIKRHKDQVVYYARPGLSLSCELFEQRSKNEGAKTTE